MFVCLNDTCMTFCAVCLMSTDATIGIEDDQWKLGVGVGTNTTAYLSDLTDSYDSEQLHLDLTILKNRVDAQNKTGQLRMRYV